MKNNLISQSAAVYNFETIECNLCGSNDKKTISNKGLYGLPTNVVLCRNCGLGYLSPRWNAKSYLDFYKHEYDKYYRPSLSLKKKIEPKRNNIIIQRLKKYSLLPSGLSSILDIGSGEGQNLVDFKMHFPSADLFAIEVSERSIKHLHKNDIIIISKDFESPWDLNNQGRFDLVIMRHVLEHLMSPVDVMKKVRSVLSNDGIAYLAVPNSLKPISKLETAWFRNVHTYYFNQFSIDNLMKIVGLEIVKLVDGDVNRPGELFMVVKKSTVLTQPEFSQNHYKEQLKVFKKKLWRDKSRIYQLYKKCLKFYKKAYFKVKILMS